MIKPVWKYLFFVAILAIGAYACVKKKNYPTTPAIEYKEFIPYQGDTADLVIKFTDGDGDIGVSSGSSDQNLFVTYYYKDAITGKYTAYYSPIESDTLRTGYIVRAPTDTYKGKPISGEFSIRLQQYRHTSAVKQLKYVIVMYDNAGNKSNILTTDEITVP